MSTGLRTAASAAEVARAAAPAGRRRTRAPRGPRSSASTARIAGPAGVGEHRYPAALRAGLVGQQRCDLEHLLSVSVRITPDCRNRAETATSTLARAPVWLLAARAPAEGAARLDGDDRLLAADPAGDAGKRRGCPNDSRYSRITSVAGSPSQYRSRSLALTSALLPTDTKVEMPMSRRRAWSRMAMPRAPL
jgi:hypothetical protein